MNKITVNTKPDGTKIDRHIYGHFSEHLGKCIYGGYWVGKNSPIPNVRGIRKDVVAALKNIRIPNIRWPGGCFADEYHWKDGIGPDRPKMINTHWGGVTEDNSFGTHEFLDLCEQLSDPAGPQCEPYICGNVGSGTVQELSQWVEYINSDAISPMTELRKRNGREAPWKVRFWGIGNENWGCGGMMTAEFYADNFRRYGVYARNYANVNLDRIACGPGGDDYNWTKVLMQKVHGSGQSFMKGLSLHYYTIPGDWIKKGSATEFGEQEWFTTMQKALYMDELIRKHGAIMDEFDPRKEISLIVDEWGTWLDVEKGTNPGFLYQQNALRDALVAALHLNIFNNHAERVRMANIAQTINVLQAVILTKDEKMILTPTYHVFDMCKVHQDAQRLPLAVDCDTYTFNNDTIPAISGSASVDGEGRIHVSLCNIDPHKEQKIDMDLRGSVPPAAKVTGQILTAANMQDHNTFDESNRVKLAAFQGANLSPAGLTVTLPPKSVVTLEIK